MRKYIDLCNLFEKLESLQSRNEMSLELATFLKECNSEEVQIISYMIQGRVAPMFVKSEFNYSEKSLLKLLSQHTGEDVQSLRKESGDIGNTVYEIWKKQDSTKESLGIKEIYEILWGIVNTSGIGAISRKNALILEGLQKLNPLESKYFVRTICGQLRLGLSMRSLLDVFSLATVGDKSLKVILEQAYGVCADIGYIGKKVFESDRESVVENLSNISAIPGTPILSRLVQRVASFDEISERFKSTVLVQPKFDGLRCQIHKWSKKDTELKKNLLLWFSYLNSRPSQTNNLFSSEKSFDCEVRLYTRNLEDVTEMFPEIVDYARELKQSSFILDSEIVGWNYKKNNFLSYQETMQRRRKYSIESKMVDVPVKAFCFDILYLSGDSLVNKDTIDRVKALEGVLVHTQGSISLAESIEAETTKQIKKYFDKSVSMGLEGVIVKQLSGGYRPGLRNYEWIKVKKSIEKDLVDTIDMVIVGYYKGSGRRSDFGLGAILGAIYNGETDTYDAICKIGTGMKDEILKDMKEKLSQYSLKTPVKNVRVVDNLKPDIWVEPKYVITVDADEITKNISNMDLLIGGGLSLRFPRLIEFDRDKGVEDITTVTEILDMYNMRKKS